jgi:hypothetical protein
MTILGGVINLIELKQINNNTLEYWGLNKFQTFEAWGGGIFPHNHATKN